MLDEELVVKPLSYLEGQSNTLLIDGLKFYQQKKYIEACEKFRRSLEEFLRYKLENDKGLERNIKEIGSLLKAQEAPNEIRNTIQKDFDYLDKFFNEHTKHGSADLGDEEVEWVLYQMGTLTRYIERKIETNTN